MQYQLLSIGRGVLSRLQVAGQSSEQQERQELQP